MSRWLHRLLTRLSVAAQVEDIKTSNRNLWWHAHGAVAPSGCFVLIVVGESKMPPEDAPLWLPCLDPLTERPLPLAYLRTWDHEPSEEEKTELTPPGYETEAEAEWTGRT